MTQHLDDLLASIQGAPVLDPSDLAAAVVEAQRNDRIGEIRSALAKKPAPKIPPRYESEIRTWLATSTVDSDPEGARLQAYAAVHLDPHNSGAIGALDRALGVLGGDVRSNSWSALLLSYPEVAPVREAATAAGVEPVSSRIVTSDSRRRRKRRPTEAVLEDAGRKAQESAAERKAEKAHRPAGIAAIIPALEPDPVQADRLAVIHIVLANSWDPDQAPGERLDPLTWAQRTLRGDTVSAPKQATGTASVIALLRGEPDPAGEKRLGPRFGKLIRRLKGHPAVVVWAARRQLEAGDAVGARRARERLDADKTTVFQSEVAELDDLLSLAGGDVERGWRAWEAGELPTAFRADLARGLIADGRESDADEVLGLPEVEASAIADVHLLEVRFDVMFDDGDIDGAIAQAQRLVDLVDAPTAAISRLWLALATSGRLTALASRVRSDLELLDTSVEKATAPFVARVDERARELLEPLTAELGEARSAAQSLAKGRTIRNEALFSETADAIKKRLGELAAQVERLADLQSGSYPINDESVVRFLASAKGWHTELAGDQIRVVAEDLPEEVRNDPVVAALTRPAREFAERTSVLRGLLERSVEDIDRAESETQRTDIARRRIEERVSRRARSAADLLSSAIEVLDLSVAIPEVPVFEDLDEPEPEDDAGDPPPSVEEPEPHDRPEVVTTAEPAADLEAGDPDDVVEADPYDAADPDSAAEADDDSDAGGRWWRRTR